MNDLPQAAVKFPWAMTLFGAQQMMASFDLATSGDPTSIEARFYRVAASARKEFNGFAPLFAGYQVGDKAQRAMIDMASDVMTGRAFQPEYLKHVGAALDKTSSDAWKSLATNDARMATLERLKNIFAVVALVNQVDAPHEMDANGEYPLEEVVDKAYEGGEYPALWSMEGIGERFAHAWMATGKPIRDMYTTGKGAKLPAKTLLMMHAGAGISFAKHSIGSLTPYSTDAEFDAALREFLDLCAMASMPGYIGPTIESLGLVTRTWNAQLIPSLTRRLQVLDPEAVEYFWHGAGRSMYFSPLNMMPGFSPWFSAETEPTDEVGKRNAYAGATWAFTVVNRRQPEIMATFLATKDDTISDHDAFLNGSVSSLIMASAMMPTDHYVSGMCIYQPAGNGKSLAKTWDKYVGGEMDAAVKEYRASLERHTRLGEIFRYHDLGKLVKSLEMAGKGQTQ